MLFINDLVIYAFIHAFIHQLFIKNLAIDAECMAGNYAEWGHDFILLKDNLRSSWAQQNCQKEVHCITLGPTMTPCRSCFFKP